VRHWVVATSEFARFQGGELKATGHPEGATAFSRIFDGDSDGE
jgi:hypothetical protein